MSLYQLQINLQLNTEAVTKTSWELATNTVWKGLCANDLAVIHFPKHFLDQV